MVAKRIPISEKPEKATVPATPPVDETEIDKPTELEEPSTDVSQTDAPQPSDPQPDPTQTDSPETVLDEQSVTQYESEADQPSTEPTPEPPRQLDIKPRVPSRRKPKFGKLKSVIPKKKRWIAVFGLIIIVAIAGVLHLKKPSSPLPVSVTQKAKFSVYYPKPNSSGYTYLAGSSSYAAGKLSYSLGPKNAPAGSGGAFVRISEQPLSGNGPDLHSLPSFTVFKVPAGEAAVGPDGQVLNGVIVTKKTLIILNALGGVSRQDLIQIINNM
jgi:hypothetical protein